MEWYERKVTMVKNGEWKTIWLIINNQKVAKFNVYREPIYMDEDGDHPTETGGEMYIPTPQYGDGYCKIPGEEIERNFDLKYVAPWETLNGSEGHEITLREMIPDPSPQYPYARKEGKAFFIWIPYNIDYLDQLLKLVIKMKNGMTATFEIED